MPACHMQRAQDEDPSDDPLLEEFKLLRRRVFQWRGAGPERLSRPAASDGWLIDCTLALWMAATLQELFYAC